MEKLNIWGNDLNNLNMSNRLTALCSFSFKENYLESQRQAFWTNVAAVLILDYNLSESEQSFVKNRIMGWILFNYSYTTTTSALGSQCRILLIENSVSLGYIIIATKISSRNIAYKLVLKKITLNQRFEKSK